MMIFFILGGIKVKPIVSVLQGGYAIFEGSGKACCPVLQGGYVMEGIEG